MLRACLLLPLLASPALADACVGAQDLTRGVRLTYADGAAVEVRIADVGVVELREVGRTEGGDLRFLAAYGLYDLEVGALRGGVVSPDQQVTYSYEPAQFEPPAAGAAGWAGTVTVAFPGGDADRQAAAYLFGREQELVLGACKYRTLSVEATFIRDTGWEGQRFLYFPDLGFATLIGRSDGSGPPRGFSIKDIAAIGS